MFSWRTHPDGDHLLRFCEGELSPREASHIARHIEGCWECRTAINDMRNLIGEYVHYRSEVLRPSLPPPPLPWIDLDDRFGDLRKPSGITRSSRRGLFRYPTIWLLFGGATLLATTVLWWHKIDLRAERTPHSTNEPKAAARSYSATVPKPEARVYSAQSADSPRNATAGSEARAVTAEDELNVLAALHQIGADLGDPIEVVRSGRNVTVTGAGLETDRVEQVQKVLSGMPYVLLRLADPPTPPEENSRAVDVKSGGAPLETNVALQFPNPAAFEQFVDETLQTSEEMMARAHALRRLADRFPPRVEDQMGRAAVDLLASIRQDLAMKLVEHAANIDRSLTPVLLTLGEKIPAQQQPGISDWQSITSTLFNSADKTDTLIGALLATTTDSKSSSTPAQLARALGQLKADSLAYRQFVSTTRRRNGK